jgi:hypothetical protein
VAILVQSQFLLPEGEIKETMGSFIQEFAIVKPRDNTPDLLTLDVPRAEM